MYIRKITINNITSLKGENVIDFTREPLRSADLFAITGDTGAGKSTILDCICLALYNRAPRFSLRERSAGAATQGSGAQQLHNYDTRNVLRRGASEGSCAVEFFTQEGTFVATWSVRVKRTGTYDTVVRSLEQIAPRKKTFDPREVQSEITRLVGLDYDQFTRTVILAQNSFANFLRAKRDEKSKLLEKITGTEIYNHISTIVYEQNQKAQADYNLKQEEYNHFKAETIDADTLRETNSRKGLLEAQQRNFDESVELLKKQLAWYDEYERLEKNVEKTTEEYSRANRASVGLTAERERLQRYDDVAAIRDKVVTVQNDSRRIVNGKRYMEELDRSEEQLRRDKAAASVELDEARAELDKNETMLRQREPLFKKAAEISREIDIHETARKEKASELEAKNKQASELRSKLEGKTNALRALEAKRENCKNTLQALTPHQAMLDQYGSVIEKIKRYGELEEAAESMRKSQAGLNDDLEKIKKAIADIESEIIGVTQQKDTLEKTRTQLQNSILGTSNEKLQKNYNEAFTLQTQLLGARRLWNSLADEYDSERQNESLISSLSITIDARKGQLHDMELETTKLRQIYEIHEKYFNMGQADSIKDMRRDLREGDPCPVCGATHHPYHSESEQRLSEVVSNAEQARDEARERYNAAEEKFNNLKTTQSSDKEKYRNLLDKRADIAHRIEVYSKDWERYAELDKSFADCSANVNADARRITITQLLENAGQTVEDTQRRLAEYNRCRSEIERCTAEMEKFTDKISEMQTKLADLRMKKGRNEGNLDTLGKNLHENADSAHEIYGDLEQLLTLADWRRLIRDDRKQLHEDITAYYDKRKACEEELQQVEAQVGETGREITTLEGSQQKITDEIQELDTKIGDIDTAIAAGRNDIVRMFGSERPDEAERLARNKIEENRKAVELKLATLNKAEQALGAAKAKRIQAETEINRIEEEKLRLNTEIDTWISAFNQNHSSVRFSELVEIFSSDCNWNAMRETLRKADSELELAGDRLKAAQAALNSWQSRPEHPDRAVETRQYIASSIDNIALKRRDTDRELEDIRRKLALHDNGVENMERLKPSLGEMEKNATEWAKLNALVGSKNGMVFSLVAQNSTLRLLVDHANAQLALFSPRYRLRKADDTLDLEIIDQYMGDEHRPVASLSGGETFVVSLALALGLASLSNRRLSIGSLFIDEGFGNLDNDSLDMVIHALSNLNAQGRKVGIISHTQQIRENIFPQIQVVRKSNADSLSTIRIAAF